MLKDFSNTKRRIPIDILEKSAIVNIVDSLPQLIHICLSLRHSFYLSIYRYACLVSA